MAPDTGTVRTWLQEAKEGTLGPDQLFPRLAAHLPVFLTQFEGTEPALTAESERGGTSGVLFTDREAARPLLADRAGELTEYPALLALQWLIRSGVKGAVLDPGAVDLPLNAVLLRLLFREYALVELSRAGGAWVPTQEGSLLVLEVKPGLHTVPVFLTEEEAAGISTRTGGQPQFHSWSVIRSRCLEAGSDGVFIQCGFPEQIGLSRPYVTRLAGEAEPDPLEAVEQAIAESQGMIMPVDFWPMLSRLDRLWALTDQDGDVVRLGETLDFFTSLNAVETFLDQLRAKGQELPVIPKFLPAQALFQWVADHGRMISINRGSRPYWLDALNGLPTVIKSFGPAPRAEAPQPEAPAPRAEAPAPRAEAPARQASPPAPVDQPSPGLSRVKRKQEEQARLNWFQRLFKR